MVSKLSKVTTVIDGWRNRHTFISNSKYKEKGLCINQCLFMKRAHRLFKDNVQKVDIRSEKELSIQMI